MSRISIAQLFDDKKEKLNLTWIAGQNGGVIELSDEKIAQSGQGMIGHLNFIHPDWIQVISIASVISTWLPVSLRFIFFLYSN